MGDEVEAALRTFPEIALREYSRTSAGPALLYVAVVSNEQRIEAESEMLSDTEAYAIRVLFVRGLIVETESQPRVATLSLPEDVPAEAALMSVLSSFLGFFELCVDFYDFFAFYRSGFGRLLVYPMHGYRGGSIGPNSSGTVWITVLADSTLTLDEFSEIEEITRRDLADKTLCIATTGPMYGTTPLVLLTELWPETSNSPDETVNGPR